MHSKAESSSRTTMRHQNNKGSSAKWFLVFWILIIALGATIAYLYSNHMKQQMITSIKADTERQISLLQSDYESRLNEMSKEMTALQSKVDSFNELLTFTKDNASSKTDNSNKLYTQLNEVQKQLNTLQKKMDLLK
ncbi:hypothetical protein PTI45_01469 [Paenibacillus nuruki]|uniref:Uncharacterized protein n=2 Tax=Paenibacillus TaxID=44249 RepID=A0A1E3L7M2_9BACL|nr:hypothetical protein PTI45_01469 [Paenibacillus nuruki]TKJ92166.1 hypothetical protein PaeCFBP13512_07635 [Paenibacillus sp. CFBP13512]CAJ1316023.1 Chromosome partition protein Smc [Paenibacillus nuruki]